MLHQGSGNTEGLLGQPSKGMEAEVETLIFSTVQGLALPQQDTFANCTFTCITVISENGNTGHRGPAALKDIQGPVTLTLRYTEIHAGYV